MPFFPPTNVACLRHLQTFIFLPWYVLSNPILFSNPCIYCMTPKLLNSPPLCLPLCSFPLYHTALLHTFSLIPSHSPSPHLSPSHLILPSHTCPLPPPHIHKHFFSPSLPTILRHSYPIYSHPSFPLIPTHCCFFLHLISSLFLLPAGSFSPQCALPSRRPCPLHPLQVLEGLLFIIT